MLIDLSKDCEIFNASNRVHLVKAIGAVAEGRHHIVRPSPVELEDLLGPEIWRLYGEYLKHSYKAVTNHRSIVHRHVSCTPCDPNVFANYLTEPLSVVVENVTTDGQFLRSVVSLLSPRTYRRMTKVPVHLVFVQAGGITEIPKVVKHLAKTLYRSRPSGMPARIMAICDSDASSRGQLSADARRVEKCKDKHGASVHVLRKRAIENYIPDETLLLYADERSDKKEAASLIASLTGEARDYYPMKIGLSAETVNAVAIYPEGIQLNIGMGDFMSDLLQEFPYLITRQRIIAHDLDGEIRKIISTMEDIL